MSRLVSIVVAAALVTAACGPVARDTTGVDLYRVSCAGCHGTDLHGGIGPPMGAGSNTAENLTDEQIRGAIAVGPGAMPGFGRGLTSEQIDSLVVYLRTEQGR